MKSTKIEWCDTTINAVIGCTFGCEYCYARRMNQRFKWIEDFSKPHFFLDRLIQLNSKTPKNIFMDSMSDVADWGFYISRSVERKMMLNFQHNYLFLTKRPRKALLIAPHTAKGNVWLGVTVTKQNDTELVDILNGDDYLLRHHFVSIEPLLEDIVTDDGFGNFLDCEWVIIGAETGNRKGKIIPKKEWVDKIVSIATEDGIPVFMKESLLKIMGEENMLREFPKELKRVDIL